MNAPRPPKSAKKKKLLKETIPSPDTSASSENLHTEFMQQKPSELMDKVEVIEEGYRTEVESGSSCSTVAALDQRDQLPHTMWARYNSLLRCATPEEKSRDDSVSLTFLEEKYGHLVEKDFWYDRVVRLASTFLEVCDEKENVFDKSRVDLEEAVGHLVPHTDEEKEYVTLFENYKKSNVQIDGIPTLDYLRKHHTHPPKQSEPQPDLEPYSPPDAERYVDVCPIHDDRDMTCLNPDQSGVLFFKCPDPDCCVFWTSDSREAVRDQLCGAIHPSVPLGLLHADLKCHCDFIPRMKLSRSQKNPGKVFLTCFKKTNPCKYFQWIHWKVREPKGPMDRYVIVEDEGQRQDRILQDVRRTSHPPFGSPRVQQLICADRLERFKKDDVRPLDKVEQYRKDPWMQQFKAAADRQEQTKEQRFLQECDANNAQRQKYGMAPYSYETYRTYGTGIF